LNEATLVVVRDPESQVELRRSGVTRDVSVGADPALLLEPVELAGLRLSPGLQEVLFSQEPKIGVCISAQWPVSNMESMAVCLDELISENQAWVVGIPMNPLTDSCTMARLAGLMTHSDRFALLTGRYLPAEILAVTSRMDVVVSSRLHLLMFAAKTYIPFVGISRGSKTDNFLKAFGPSTAGSVENWNCDRIQKQVRHALTDNGSFRLKSQSVIGSLYERLGQAKALAKRVIAL
jgi:polysaccharide pyruvyl transferase WcaK-like protein